MKDDPAAVDAYLQALPANARAALAELRTRIRALAPDATERIAYQVPAFFHDGALVSYGARPGFCSLYVQSPTLVARLAEELAGCTVTGATIHFTPDAPLPDAALTAVVRGRLAENAARRTQSERRGAPGGRPGTVGP
jgi:uncharacterized protein YdhG (YjbR/CyaY superfamily)